jgi:hypothetical protein
MAKHELNLLKLATGTVAETGAGATQIMGSKTRQAHLPCILLNHVPDYLLRNSITPENPGSTDTTEQFAALDAACAQPLVKNCLDPGWEGYRPNVTALTHQVDDGPPLIALLDVLQRQFRQFAAAQTAAKKNGQDGPIALPL